MCNVFENIWLGVVAGVLTSAVLFLAAIFWRDSLLPFIKNVRYQGVLVSGTWSANMLSEVPGAPPSSVALVIEQQTQVLTGVLHINNREPGNEFDLSFQAYGRLWEGYLSLTLTPVDRKITSVATCLFKLSGGGTHLQGVIALRDVNREKVTHQELSLFRDGQIVNVARGGGNAGPAVGAQPAAAQVPVQPT